MMMTQFGGYDYDFVPDVPINFICVNCNLPLKEACQIEKCGHRLCKLCYSNMKQQSLSNDVDLKCPYDKEGIEESKVFSDTAVEKDLRKWNVKCPNSINYCMWVGPLEQLKVHQMSCQKDNTQPNCVSNEDIQMLIQKTLTLEAKVENCENELKICKLELSEKSKALDSVQKEMKMLKSLLQGKRQVDHIETQNETQSMTAKAETQNAFKDRNVKLEEPLKVNYIKDKTGNNYKNGIHGMENAVTIIETNRQSVINEIDLSNFENQYQWMPQTFERLAKAKTQIVSPKFVHQSKFFYQIKFRNSGDFLFITLININQVLYPYGCKCKLTFDNLLGQQQSFNFHLWETEEETKKMSLPAFKLHYLKSIIRIKFFE